MPFSIIVSYIKLLIARRVGVARRHFYTENNVPVWHKTRMNDDDEDDVNDD